MMLKKSTKRFVISSETMNSKGFRVRTDGINIDPYRLNPILLFNHERPKGKSTTEVLPLGNVVDLEFKDGKLYGTPAFDPSDAFAMNIYEKIENGTMRMVSAGLKDDEWKSLTGELWLEKSTLREISITDIGSNPDSLPVVLYNDADELVTLSADFLKSVIPTHQKSKDDMEIIKLTGPELLVKLKLDQNATSAQFQSALTNLVTLTETQATTISTLTAEKEAAEKKAAEADKLKDAAVKLASETALVTLHDEVVTRDRKMTEDAWLELKDLPIEKLKAYTAKLPANPTVQSVLNGNVNTNTATEEMKTLSWDELEDKGLDQALYKADKELYKLKYKEKFDREFVEA